MFLEPDVRRPKTGNHHAKNMSNTGFFSSQRPIASPRDRHSSYRRRSLQPTSQSQLLDHGSSQIPEHPSTVRLVDASPSPPSTTSSQQSYDQREDNDETLQQSHSLLPRVPLPALVKRASVSDPAISATSQDYDVSETSISTNEDLRLDNGARITLLPNKPQHELSSPSWHRLSSSSAAYSQASTLRDSEIGSSKKSGKSQRFSSFSQISTLRNTPTPTEEENRERAEEAGLLVARSQPGLALQTLQETSPERPTVPSTIRPVQSRDSSSPIEHHTGSEDTSSSRPHSAQSSDLEQAATSRYSLFPAETTPSRPIGLAAQKSSANWRARSVSDSSNPHTILEAVFLQPSSPNFIAYSPDSQRPISREDLIRSVTSIESINARIGSTPTTRPETGRSAATSSSWETTASKDTLPPLHIPKKRLRHKAGSESLSTQASIVASSSYAAESMADDEDIDTLPYPKRPFSSHLSTIASESDRSRTASHRHASSHFSLGSGVLTGDDASSLPLSPVHRRTDSAPAASSRSDGEEPGTRATNSSEFQEEAGDMTLGIYREESAMPQPLFRPGPAYGTTKTYDGPHPPMPPIPKDGYSDENFDTLSALQDTGLKTKRSGRSLRERSKSTPSYSSHSRQPSQVSYVDSERFSQGSSLFPTWAKHFYSGTHVLKSKVSLMSMSTAGQRSNQTHHRRNQSSMTERSITSRLGTGYSNNAEPESPASSHFLPAIFRPRNRKRHSQQDSRSSNKIRKSGRSKPSTETKRDSMAIHQDPLPQSQEPLTGNQGNEDFLPSGQPRWGTLKGSERSSPDSNRPLPRKYSKQRLWDQMEFPRPMTKDRLSDFNLQPGNTPHLHPAKRASQQRLSAWQAPSFVSSLDTLLTSRCNRQILLFALGFVCPLMWMLGALLPLPHKPMNATELEKGIADSQDDVQTAMMKHEAGDAEKTYKEEKTYNKARWWRMLNRVMSVVGLLVIGAIIALVVVATT